MKAELQHMLKQGGGILKKLLFDYSGRKDFEPTFCSLRS
jgi:hypothetical protein